MYVVIGRIPSEELFTSLKSIDQYIEEMSRMTKLTEKEQADLEKLKEQQKRYLRAVLALKELNL